MLFEIVLEHVSLFSVSVGDFYNVSRGGTFVPNAGQE